MGHHLKVAIVIQLVPKNRVSTRPESAQRQLQAQSAPALLRSALEPSGTGPYVEAVREWIERVTPRAQQRSPLRLVR